MTEKRNAYRVLIGETEKSRPLERPRQRWEHIEMGLNDI
jgi:hypothetical protein